MFCRNRLVCGWLLTCLLVLGGAGLVHSADAPEKETAKKPRLPNHFGKLDLSEEQKQKVYAAQKKFGKEISDLREKLKKLQADQEKEMEGALTADQLAKLKTLQSEAKAKKPTTATVEKK